MSVRQQAVSGSQMTHYFADKDSLIPAVISHQTQAILDFHRQPALRDLDTLEDFDTWAQLTLRFGRRNRARPVPSYGGLCAEIADYDDKTQEILAEGQRQWAETGYAGGPFSPMKREARGTLFRSGGTRLRKCGSAHDVLNADRIRRRRPYL
jgi:AcrR family transcriptional regulator